MSGLLDNLPHTCTAKRRRRYPDERGGFIDTYPTILFSSRECWRQKASDREVNWWQAKSIDVTNRVFFVVDPALTENDVLVFPDSPGYYYQVQSYAEPDDSAGLGLMWRVMVQRVRGET